MTFASIPRGKACIFWNDIPSGFGPDDIMVENSAGAIESDFAAKSSAEQVFADFFATDYILAVRAEIAIEIFKNWLSEFEKIEGFDASAVAPGMGNIWSALA